MFATITHLEDVLPHISLENGIGHFDHGAYQVLDYNYVDKDTFDSSFALECRGLKFAPSGELIARPFHKFFNLGEREQPDQVDFSQAHVVLEKRDGSMIHPCLLDGVLVFMTRRGKTAQADLALAHARAEALALSRAALEAGITPVFEFTSLMNRVVVEYATPELILLAARHMTDGAYLTHAELVGLAAEHDVPVVESYGAVPEIGAFARDARALEGLEGYVIAFDDGHRLKLKADAYVLRHRALEGLKYEKVVLRWIIEGAVDDVLAILRPDAAEVLSDYAAQVERSLAALERELEAFHLANKERTRKDYAMAAKAEVDPKLQRVVFGLLDGRDARSELMAILGWAAHAEARVETIRSFLGTRWRAPDLSAVDA